MARSIFEQVLWRGVLIKLIRGGASGFEKDCRTVTFGPVHLVDPGVVLLFLK